MNLHHAIIVAANWFLYGTTALAFIIAIGTLPRPRWLRRRDG
jgi:hypothetical protein